MRNLPVDEVTWRKGNLPPFFLPDTYIEKLFTVFFTGLFDEHINMKRTIFIGDVHGCYLELKQLVEELRLSEQDRVIMLGDLINRGPDPAGVVKLVHEYGFETLMGNHEYHYLSNYKKHKPYHSLYESIGPELHEWIRNLPAYIEDEHFIAVHAGLIPELPLSRTHREILLNVRTWDGKGKDMKSPKNPPWYELYTGKRPVIYGHWASQGLTIRHNTMGIDTGCVYGGSLTALILEKRRLVQIPAKEVYKSIS